ncbi:MAG: rRNA pseudouridine synthase [Desulfohalobiaceae bacterium]|nr:rRNA pseudouridine synthase [Desulfohalobiaceae bacterium]
MRLNKAIASAGLCSRRRADELITRGEVRVNGVLVRILGTKIDPMKDTVDVAGKRLGFMDPDRKEHLYLALHKPPGVISSARDPQGRTIVLDLLPESITKHRVLPVGRLDFDSEGLLLLTNDGAMIHHLTHPRHEVAKTYRVLVQGPVTPDRLETMRRGMPLQEGKKLAPVSVTVLKRQQDRTWLKMILNQGVNRQIRRMCRDLGLGVIRLIRVRQGPVDLRDLPRGKFRYLSASEIEQLTGPGKGSRFRVEK